VPAPPNFHQLPDTTLASGQLPWFGRKAANARILRH
jgi:hypothetical protein